MAFFSPPSSAPILKPILISLFLLSTLLLFLLSLSPPSPSYPSPTPIIPHRSLLNTSIITTTTAADKSPPCFPINQTPPSNRCEFSLLHCTGDSDGLLNYFSLHFCLFRENLYLSIPSLSALIVLQFYILVKTAQDRFSVVVTKLSAHLNLSPSMGAVTLLALGNGAPDVFASVAAVRSGHSRTGFGAILSAGTFVSAFVVGFVAIYAAPFPVETGSFVRDVLFYLIAALSLFYVYLSAEIFLWQAIGFVGFYLFFVGIVFWMDLGAGTKKRKSGGGNRGGSEMGFVENGELQKILVEIDSENGDLLGKFEAEKQVSWFWQALGKACLKLSSF